MNYKSNSNYSNGRIKSSVNKDYGDLLQEYGLPGKVLQTVNDFRSVTFKFLDIPYSLNRLP